MVICQKKAHDIVLRKLISVDWNWLLKLVVPKINAHLQLTQAKMDQAIEEPANKQQYISEAEQKIVDEMVEWDALTLTDSDHVCH